MDQVTSAVVQYLIASGLGQFVKHSVHRVCEIRPDLGHSHI